MATAKFVKTFAAACKKLNIAAQLPDVSSFPESHRRQVLAEYQLAIIIQANNGDWKANIADTDQWKYYPWFEVVPDKSKPSGFGLSFHDFAFVRTHALLGSRLACKDRELAKFMGENCTDLYIDYFSNH